MTLLALVMGGAGCSTATGEPAGREPNGCDESRAQRVFAKCQVCHPAVPDAGHLTGPNLYGVLGKTAGTAEGFRFSPALRGSGLVWTPENLDAFLKSPQQVIPGNTMAFTGLRRSADREAVICYLASLRD